ncbi:hotdog family protein [Pelagibius sp. 7325]|uniref:hotdog family protein n=1 Tax=Pelagibius sp. 7325 TaxID=3131994 RepID=UPI0030EB7593
MNKIPWPVEQLLPHSRSMVLLDEAIDAGEDWAMAGVRIAEDCLFYDPQARGVPAWVGIEYMAQTVALFSGVHAQMAGQAVKLGLLLGTRRYEAFCDSFSLGSYLTVRVSREWDDGQMAVFDCTVSRERELASARINVYLPDNLAALLAGAAP